MKLEAAIETKRLVLKSLEPGDGRGRYADWMNDPEVVRFLEVRHGERSPESLAAYIKQINDSPDNYLLGIFSKDGGGHIGNIKLGPVNSVHRRAAIGLFIGDRSTCGKGYATEAVDRITRFAFDDLGLHKVVAGCHKSNAASEKVFLKAGFIKEGEQVEYWRIDGKWDSQVLFGRVS